LTNKRLNVNINIGVKEMSTEKKTKFISARFPVWFVDKFDNYLKEKQEEENHKGGIKKITNVEMIFFAINDMIDKDGFKS
jgi:hypothetical protein